MRRRRVIAFTLIETLIVVAIIASMLGTIIVSLRGRAEQRQIESAASDLATVVRYARREAAATHRPHRLAFDAALERYWVESRGPLSEGFEPVRGTAGMPHPLGAGVVITGLSTAPALEAAGPVAEFLPDGSGFSGTLTLTMTGQTPHRIDILAGATQVHESH